MHKYTVACGSDGIYAGIMNHTKEDGTKSWKIKSECTEAALEAAFDFIVNKCNGTYCRKINNKTYIMEIHEDLKETETYSQF